MAKAPVEQLTYEQARDELTEVVRSLETGSATLEESLQLWERGEALAAHCQAFLDGARARLDAAAAAKASPASTVRATPANLDEDPFGLGDGADEEEGDEE